MWNCCEKGADPLLERSSLSHKGWKLNRNVEHHEKELWGKILEEMF